MGGNPKNAERTVNPSQVGRVGRAAPKAFVQQQMQQWAAAAMQQPAFQQMQPPFYQPMMQQQQPIMQQMLMQQFAGATCMQMPMQQQAMGMPVYFDSGATRDLMQ